jgi:hypothetical protein
VTDLRGFVLVRKRCYTGIPELAANDRLREYVGTRQALLNHTERLHQLKRKNASRFPDRTKADVRRTRKGSRNQSRWRRLM